MSVPPLSRPLLKQSVHWPFLFKRSRVIKRQVKRSGQTGWKFEIAAGGGVPRRG